MKVRFKVVFLIVFTSIFIISCGSKKKVVTSKKDQNRNVTRVDQRSTTEDAAADKPISKPVSSNDPKSEKPVFKDKVSAYVYQFKDVAMSEMKLYQIPQQIKNILKN